MCALLRAILPKGRKRKSLFVIPEKKLMRRSPLYIIFFVNRLANDAIFTLEKTGTRVSQVIYGPRRYRWRVEIFILFFYLLWSVRDEFSYTFYFRELFAKFVRISRIYSETSQFFTFGEKLMTLARLGFTLWTMKFLWLILVFARCAWSRSTLMYSTHPRQLVFKDGFVRVFFVEAIT